MNPELGCKHRYIATNKKTEARGYWFKCVHCGKEIFGGLGK